MAMVRFDPFRDLNAMQERMNLMFGEMRRGDDDLMSRGTWLPPVDIYQTGEHEIVLKAEVPGVSKDDLELRVENNTLTIKGERKVDSNVPEEQFHRIERSYGTFVRSFSLPNTIDFERVRADYRDGVLSVTLPLREEARPRQIQVQVG